jgi:hypothetical protein
MIIKYVLARRKVIREFETTIADLLTNQEAGGASSAQFQEVVAERDRLREELRMKNADLKETETAFNSIHA